MQLRYIAAVIWTSSVLACGPTPPTEQGPWLELLIRTVDFGSGVVRTEPGNIRFDYNTDGGGEGGGDGRFPPGTTVKVIAEPTAGSQLIGWLGEGCDGASLICTPTFDRVTFVRGYLVGSIFFESAAPESVELSVSLITYPNTTEDPTLEGAGTVRVEGLPGGPVTCALTRTGAPQCTGPSGPLSLPVLVADGSTVTLVAIPRSDSRFRRWLVPGCGREPTCVLTVKFHELNWFIEAWFEGIPSD
jgi:hypothetical protein